MRMSGGILRFILLAAALATMPGCGGGAAVRAQRAELAKLSYPADAETGQTLDVRVVREGSRVRLANATPRAYRDMQLWLNRRYVQRVEQLSIGTDNRYRLGRFVNRHGEPFPVAGLLSPRKTEPVVLAELYNPRAEVRHQLIVQPDETEDE